MEPLIKATGGAWIFQLNAGVFACGDDLRLNISTGMGLDPIRIISEEVFVFPEKIFVIIMFTKFRNSNSARGFRRFAIRVFRLDFNCEKLAQDRIFVLRDGIVRFVKVDKIDA